MSNQKYEITDFTHEKYPFLHRIRALRDIGSDVKEGDLGGFVESEGNLSIEPEDTAWLYNDAIAAGNAYVDKASVLLDRAVACDCAYVTQGSVMRGDARAEDNAYLRGAVLRDSARTSGNSMILNSPDTGGIPCLSGKAVVFGTIAGDVHVTGSAVVFGNEE